MLHFPSIFQYNIYQILHCYTISFHPPQNEILNEFITPYKHNNSR